MRTRSKLTRRCLVLTIALLCLVWASAAALAQTQDLKILAKIGPSIKLTVPTAFLVWEGLSPGTNLSATISFSVVSNVAYTVEISSASPNMIEESTGGGSRTLKNALEWSKASVPLAFEELSSAPQAICQCGPTSDSGNTEAVRFRQKIEYSDEALSGANSGYSTIVRFTARPVI